MRASALALKDNKLYQSTQSSFAQCGFAENIQMMQGFILGMLARGLSSSDSKMLSNTVDILNGGVALSGKAIAIFTTLMIELERDLKQNTVNLFLPTAKDKASNKERITALSDVAHGVLLGLSVPDNAGNDAAKELDPMQSAPINVMSDPKSAYMEIKRKSAAAQEQLQTLEAIANADSDSELDEEDFECVATEVAAIVADTFTRNHIHN